MILPILSLLYFLLLIFQRVRAPADKALESGKAEPLLKLLTESMQAEVREKFKQALAKKKYRPDDVEAGRAYVDAYVPFVQYVEQIYEAVKSPSDGHLHRVEREAAHR